jgi:hypothetical protein
MISCSDFFITKIFFMKYRMYFYPQSFYDMKFCGISGLRTSIIRNSAEFLVPEFL